MRRSAVLLLTLVGTLSAAEPASPRDRVRTLDDKDFFFTVPATKAEWEVRRQAVRERVLVATGLWPMPEKTPLQAVIHGKIERAGYTIEKVFFTSTPGHIVSGNLYRPLGKDGKHPGVLFAHGHWRDGRLHDAGEEAARKQVEQKAEGTMESARYPLQALPAQLARMGCVVFHYDMIGVADSKAIPHGAGFADAEAELRLQSALGLQTWNSVRALDFLTSLPDVDAQRIGVTGASGGGTQTFILCAIDDRPTVAFPAVMVSTQMQGGCVCENASCLRVGTGNVELAALFAPKPLGMTGANDWTVDIEKKGLPELKELYRLYGAEERVMAKCFPQFEHNYNQMSREVMYAWFNQHLGLGLSGTIHEQPFEPMPPAQLSVFDATHPRPSDERDGERLRKMLSEASDRQIAALKPTDAKSLAEYRRVIGTALRVMVADTLPTAGEVESDDQKPDTHSGYRTRKLALTRKNESYAIPALAVLPDDFDGTVVVWVHRDGVRSLFVEKTALAPAAQRLVAGKAALLAIDAYGTGSAKSPREVDSRYAGYTLGYNRSTLAERVHDILTAVAFAKGHEKTKRIHLVGWDQAGAWTALARGLCGDAVDRTAVDFAGFRFESVRATSDPMLLPGALKYGGLGALTALAAPGELFVHHHQGTGTGQWLQAVYSAAGATPRLERHADQQTADEVVKWLLR